MKNPNISIRIAEPEDEDIVLDIIKRTAFFREVEIDIAREVFTEAAQNKPGCTYQSFVAEIRGTNDERRICGWVCFGETPCTEGTFDIYWIAVDPTLQRQGAGKFMLDFSEKEIKKQSGRIAVVETSGMKRYESTQKFYEKNNYTIAAKIPDFYAPGDDKLIYVKKIVENH
ncbi:MAG: GNAT family N-acetyltransferase [Sedimentisphaerales bacterium]|nr:GNAT family N-acetyltransferase [Sedimentisphaerales bacterium]